MRLKASKFGGLHTDQGLSYVPTVKLLRLNESGKATWSCCLIRRTNTSFTDQDVGSRVIMCYPGHPRNTYVGAEADDWQILKDINGRTEEKVIR